MTLTWDTGLVVVLSSSLFSYQNEEPDAVGGIKRQVREKAQGLGGDPTVDRDESCG